MADDGAATATDKKALAVALGLLEGNTNDNNGDASSFAGLPPLFQPIPSADSKTTSSYVYPPSSFPPPSTFEVSIVYHALLVPKRRTQQIVKVLKDVMIHRPRLRVVLELSQEDDVQLLPLLHGVDKTTAKNRSDYRKIVLKFPVVEEEDDDDEESRPYRHQHYHHHPAIQTLMAESSGEVVWSRHTLTLSYEDWTAEEVLRRLLPLDKIPSAMEQVGHLAHLNLRDELLPFKYLIGKVLLDKNKGLKTIVNKVGTIETEYRTFGMEVIAGDDAPGWSEVTVKEEGCHYSLDFQRVYWNSRLGREHQRIVKRIRKDAKNNDNSNNNNNKLGATTIVADLMAGIGPFAIPLTAEQTLLRGDTNGKMVHKGDTGIVVYANDLNPASFEYLTINAESNRCGDRLHMYNMDARAFCHKLQDEGIVVNHFIMNLPKTALEFLDAFRGYKVAEVVDKGGHQRPWIHVHCFASKDPIESEKEIWDRCEAALGCSLDKSTDQVTVHEVRDVAPNKNMYCVSFRLPTAAQSLPRIAIESISKPKKEEPDAKRSKLS